jgi:hypothetical protein
MYVTLTIYIICICITYDRICLSLVGFVQVTSTSLGRYDRQKQNIFFVVGSCGPASTAVEQGAHNP